MLRYFCIAVAALTPPVIALGEGLPLYLPENAVYRYVNATPETTVAEIPPDWFAVDFDDSGWFVGPGAFGTGFGQDLDNAHGPDTPDADQYPGGTPWATNHDPYLRTSFDLPVAMDLTLWIAVDNGVQSIYLNGIHSTAFFNAEGQAHRWEHVFDIPAAFVHAGQNLLALQIEDHGVATGFAMVITADDSGDHPGFTDEPGEPFCFGVGCPCGNDVPLAGCANSTGEGALLTAVGTASVAADDLVLVSTRLPTNRFAILFMGPDRTSVPFGDGIRCVDPGPEHMGFFRFPVRNSGPDGQFLLGPGIVAYSQGFGSGGTILPGSTWNFQGFYRDKHSPCSWNFNLTNALGITFH